MLKRTPTLRTIFLINILAIVPIGYLVRFSPFLPEVIRDLGGNIAYETLLILLVLFVKPSTNRSKAAIGVFLFTCALEFLQLNRSPWLQAIRATTIGRLILGTDFVWSDFIGYAIGCWCGYLWIRLLDRWYRSKDKTRVWKARPKIQVVLTRDSVCAGDDCEAPHEQTIKVHSFVNPEIFAKEVSSGYLPTVAGVGHTWTCVLNGVQIAEIKTSGIRSLVRESPFSEENRAHFVYHSAPD